MDSTRRTLCAALLALGAGLLAGRTGTSALAHHLASSPPPAAAPTEHTFGLANALELRGDPRETIPLFGRDAWLRFSVTSRFEEEARLRHVVELADERGRAVEPPRHVPASELAPGATAAYEIPLPTRLDDGFYRYRITAVARAGRESADAVLEIGLAVFDGTAQPIDDNQWFEHSLANQGEPR
jgi:hypothetical protein